MKEKHMPTKHGELRELLLKKQYSTENEKKTESLNLGWILFRAPSISDAISYIKDMNKTPLTMKKKQEVSLEILKQVADLCEELNLRYFLAWGTLIGAIRHKGFIPWDDDVDIMMPRPDYDKLLEFLSTHKLSNLTLFNRQTFRKKIKNDHHHHS